MRSRREVLRVLAWSGAGAVFGSVIGCGQGGGAASKTENLENRDILVKPSIAADGVPTGAAAGGACGLPSETSAGSTCGKADAQAAATQGEVADAGASDGSAGPDAGPGAQGA
ncbi:MAG TPA: hypothetical protein PK095_18660, partial [Myxococcota bacterium]|nr:hypothetical protein [Myxococcota bacterium]